MSINSINGAGYAKQYEQQLGNMCYHHPAVEPQRMVVVQPQVRNIDQVNFEEKPKVMSSYGTGILRNLASFVPILSSWQKGDMIETQNQAESIMDDLRDGTVDEKHEEAGFGKKWLTGVGRNLANFVPILGTYLRGKEKNEREQLEKDIEILKSGGQLQPKEEHGFFDNLFTGMVVNFKNSVPFYGTYYRGHEKQQVDKLNNDAQEILNLQA